MATLTKRVEDLERWKTAHIQNHVLSGHTHPHTHSESALLAHGHPDLAKWPHTHEPPGEPEPVPEPAPAPLPGTPVPVGGFVPAIQNATAGQTLVVAPGTHDLGTGGVPVRLLADGVSVIAQSPTPLIRPTARPNGLWIEGSDTVVRGLGFAGTDPGTYNDSQGSALLEVDGQSPVRRTLLEDLTFDLPSGAAKVQHALYLRDTVEWFTARRIRFNARGSMGTGLHGYHSNPVRAHDVLIEDCTFTGFYDAILFWLACDRLTIRNCDFIGTRQMDIRVKTGGLVTVEGCRGSKGILLDPATSDVGKSVLVESGNDWAWVP